MNNKKQISQINTINDNKKAIKNYLEFLASLKRTIGTRKNVDFILTKLARFLEDTNFKKATEKQMQNFFKNIKSYSTYNVYGAIIIRFLVWNLDLDKKQRPACMKWFEYISNAKMEKESDPDGVKRFLITSEEYQIIINSHKDQYGMYHALWETFYLSGGRLGEVANMQIKDVRIEGNNVSVVLYESKTKPRVVPLIICPHALLRWLGNHPRRDDSNAPLWCHMYNQNKVNEPISKVTIENVFWQIRNSTTIKKTLSPHCFRKTRATLMFNERSNDGGLIYSDTHMAKFFGWTLQTVAERRQQYDLTTQQDLQNLVFGRHCHTTIPTYDVMKQEKELLEKDYKEKLDDMQKQMDQLADMMVKIKFEAEKKEVEEGLRNAPYHTNIITRKDGTSFEIHQTL